MASSLEKVGGLTLSVLRSLCGVFEPKVVQVTEGFVQVTEGFVKEDGHLAFFESNVLLFIPRLCRELKIFPALWSAGSPVFFLLKRAEPTSDKDMYLDNSSVEEASGVYPIDDDDYASASGSGADEDVESPETTTSRPLPKIGFTSAVPKVETTTWEIQNKIPAQTKSPEEIDKEKVHLSDSERKMDPAEDDTNVYTEKHSDNLFKRTEVLAAVIAGGVIGFLFAIFLILLLVYRMRKKDEGSYDLGERKPSSAAYQKAPTKEFYA
ncbi:syndecan-2 isoform X1 [Neofelis nebulosa]|uniref:syndecan-2 isoform X1 n=1 Tax=Neofelis nebulosa TaxID=61452 RepID=UPI00272B38AF|nr:syndecan-2 isoform X1 [Neofelis nebulosa]